MNLNSIAVLSLALAFTTGCSDNNDLSAMPAGNGSTPATNHPGVPAADFSTMESAQRYAALFASNNLSADDEGGQTRSKASLSRPSRPDNVTTSDETRQCESGTEEITRDSGAAYSLVTRSIDLCKRIGTKSHITENGLTSTENSGDYESTKITLTDNDAYSIRLQEIAEGSEAPNFSSDLTLKIDGYNLEHGSIKDGQFIQEFENDQAFSFSDHINRTALFAISKSFLTVTTKGDQVSKEIDGNVSFWNENLSQCPTGAFSIITIQPYVHSPNTIPTGDFELTSGEDKLRVFFDDNGTIKGSLNGQAEVPLSPTPLECRVGF